GVSPDRSQSRRAWAGSRRTDAIVGKYARRTAELSANFRVAVDSCARAVSFSGGGKSAFRGVREQYMGIGLRAGVLALAAVAGVSAQSGGELRFCLRADPKTFDPLLAEEEPSDVG